jgi:hypothetical protein
LGEAVANVVPSQVVDLITKRYPMADANPLFPIPSVDAAMLSTILKLVEDIRDELITIHGDAYIDFAFGIEAIKTVMEKWTHNSQMHPAASHNGKNPVVLVLHALRQCPDQSPSKAAAGLQFIKNYQLRESIRLDVSSASAGLSQGHFKTATVLAGSALEALLFWAIESKGITKTPAGVKTKKPNPEGWDLGEFIKVAHHEKIIDADTAKQAELAKDFRNLIHPGRTTRLKMVCDRGTALSALAAVEHVVRNLS